ncbi:hypothetical protein [Pseudomonas asplenii]|uniref:hypothetical protein n=1 Tax=Pseudomonas asplenii TaxID=53407 RepID=UPI0012FD5793|nr:hypothetical protein [Pseudomonas asplenii]
MADLKIFFMRLWFHGIKVKIQLKQLFVSYFFVFLWAFQRINSRLIREYSIDYSRKYAQIYRHGNHKNKGNHYADPSCVLSLRSGSSSNRSRLYCARNFFAIRPLLYPSPALNPAQAPYRS